MPRAEISRQLKFRVLSREINLALRGKVTYMVLLPDSLALKKLAKNASLKIHSRIPIHSGVKVFDNYVRPYQTLKRG